MTWTMFEHDMPRNPRIASLSDRAFRIWVESICWSVGAGTNGVISKKVPNSARTTVEHASRTIPELVEAGCFIEENGCYLIHDFEQYQEKAEAVKRRREATKERMRRYRDRQSRSDSNDSDQ